MSNVIFAQCILISIDRSGHKAWVGWIISKSVSYPGMDLTISHNCVGSIGTLVFKDISHQVRLIK